MTAIAQKVEMQFGARDSGAGKALDAIRAASDRAEKSASKLGNVLIGFGAGFLTAGFAKKVVSYAVDVAKAADSTSKLGERAQKFGEAFDRFAQKFESAFVVVLEEVLPYLTEGFDALASSIESVGKALGLLETTEAERLQKTMVELQRGNTMFVNPGNRQLLEQSGARIEPRGDSATYFGDEVTNREEVLKRLADRLREIQEESAKASKQLTVVVEAKAETPEPPQRITAKQQAQQDRNNSFFIGASEAVDRLSGSIMNLGDLGAASVDLLNQGLMGTADILVDSFRSTENLGESFKQLGSDLLAQLAKMLVYQALLRGASGALGGLGFAHGGVMRSGSRGGDEPLRLSAYAYGGVARGPQIAVYGETSRPEAYVPLPDGRSIPVTMAASGGDTFNMYVSAIDARSFEQRLAAHPRVYTSAMRRGMASNGGDRSAVRRAAR